MTVSSWCADRSDLKRTAAPLTAVRLPVPAALMEAAVVSGRLAANAILHREGLKEIPISTVAPQGPLVF